uniref:F-box domain-containing protein n=1 Tax=Macrostomum lignano TaxID=282301 RepID=A0A1I8HAJ5_9PLAT
MASANDSVAEPAEVIPWRYLPEPCLVRIFEHLSLRDRIRAAGTCPEWLATSEHPLFWRRCFFKFVDESDAWLCTLPERYGRHFGGVQLAVDQGNQRMRQLALSLLDLLGQFAVSGKEFEDALVRLFNKLAELPDHVGLRRVDLSGAELGIRDGLVLALASGHGRTLQCLSIMNGALVAQVSKETVMQLLDSCPRLEWLELMNASFSERAMLYLAEHRRHSFRYLALHVSAETKQRLEHPWLPEVTWSRVSALMPQLRVSVTFDTRIPIRYVCRFLQPSLPLEELYLKTHTHLANEISYVARTFSRTLRRLCILASEQSADLYAAFGLLAEKCGQQLEVLQVHCPLPREVVHHLLDRCPRLLPIGRSVLRYPTADQDISASCRPPPLPPPPQPVLWPNSTTTSWIKWSRRVVEQLIKLLQYY